MNEVVNGIVGHSNHSSYVFYIYAILHSNAYRDKYDTFLKIDFPRIPFTEDKKLFVKLSHLGEALVNVHLLKDISGFDDNLGNYMRGKNHKVVKPNFVIEKGKEKLFINSTNYFDNVPESAFDYFMCEYPVFKKYLKDRKGRVLSSNEIYQMENIIRSLAFTIDIHVKVRKRVCFNFY